MKSKNHEEKQFIVMKFKCFGMKWNGFNDCDLRWFLYEPVMPVPKHTREINISRVTGNLFLIGLLVHITEPSPYEKDMISSVSYSK